MTKLILQLKKKFFKKKLVVGLVAETYQKIINFATKPATTKFFFFFQNFFPTFFWFF